MTSFSISLSVYDHERTSSFGSLMRKREGLAWILSPQPFSSSAASLSSLLSSSRPEPS